MALVTITAISGESHFIEVDRSISKSVDCKIILEFFAGVDLVNHRLHVDGFDWQFVGWTACFIVPVGIMAHDTVITFWRIVHEAPDEHDNCCSSLARQPATGHRLAIRYGHSSNLLKPASRISFISLVVPVVGLCSVSFDTNCKLPFASAGMPFRNVYFRMPPWL